MKAHQIAIVPLGTHTQMEMKSMPVIPLLVHRNGMAL